MIRPFGEAAFLVETPDADHARALAAALRHEPPPGLLGAVPGLESLLVELDPLAADRDSIERLLAAHLERRAPPLTTARLRTIPVVYGGESGPDLDAAAQQTGLAPDDVIRRHAGTELRALFLGFAPGFAYLGDLPDELRVPRLATPRTRTPRGSVAIAGRMSGIYPAELPGGWLVIGRTPLALFDPDRDPPTYLLPGDRVRFQPIAPDDWHRYGSAAEDW